MTIVVEDGSAPSGANSYVSEDELDTYADDRATELADGDAEAALIRASAAVDARYRGRYPGYRTNGRAQSMEWPRTAAYDNEWNPIAGNEVPVELKNAVCEIAIRELSSPGSFIPDLERGGQIKMLKAGSVEIEYADNAIATTTFQLVDGILAPILSSAVASFSGYATRG
jgi:hypothetical protein